MSELEGLSPEDVQRLASLTLKIAGNPKTKREYLKLIKQIDDSFEAPELAIEETEQRVASKVEERIKPLEDKLQQEELRRKYEELRMEPVRKGLVSEDELPELEKFAKERGFLPTQLLQAAQLRAAERSMVPPEAPPVKPWSEGDEERRKNPQEWFRKQATQRIAELRNKRFGVN
ncbi:MAG: hypothetical protein IRY96_03880 [Burkholderiales bacterium]|nr:hypothetical protein [Burkholderiales bacterium]